MFTDSTAGYFPLKYFADFLGLLAGCRDTVEFITYDDLPWGDDEDYRGGYPLEYARWQAQLASGERSRDKAYVLIQHDVDNHPERTLRMLDVEHALGVRSNVMLFQRRVDRRHYEATGEMREKPYAPDFAAFARYQQAGFVMAYHANAYEQSCFDRARAERIFHDDVTFLRGHFPVRYFSAHGGCKDAEGHSNNHFEPATAELAPLRWVHNRYTVRFARTFSDGGINNRNRHPEEKNLCEFLRQVRPGLRYRVLVHPQYYADEYAPSPVLRGVPWYDEILDFYGREPDGDYWQFKRPSLGSPVLRKPTVVTRLRASVESLRRRLSSPRSTTG